MAKAQEVAKVDETSNAVEVYDYGSYAGAGSNQIENTDVTIPRLKLVQAMTPEAKDASLGVGEGDLIHSITKEVLYKRGTPHVLIAVPIAYSKEFVLWRDRKMGGGIMNRARRVLDPKTHNHYRYRWDITNADFEDKLDGKLAVKYHCNEYIDEDGLSLWGTQIPGDKTSGPAATETHNFIMALPGHDWMVIALSLSRTAAKKAKDLNYMIKTQTERRIPMFALRFGLSTVMESKDSNTWANYLFKPAGLVKPDDPNFEYLAKMYENFQTTKYTVDVGDDEAPATTGSSGDAF